MVLVKHWTASPLPSAPGGWEIFPFSVKQLWTVYSEVHADAAVWDGFKIGEHQVLVQPNAQECTIEATA